MSFRSSSLFSNLAPAAPAGLQLKRNDHLDLPPERAPGAQASLSYAFVHTDEQLKEALDDLGAPDTLYIDTEFQSFKRNDPVVLSLVQVSGGGATYVLDAIELDLSAHPRLVHAFGREGVEWVLHDAAQDVDHLCRALGVSPPRRLFDTQVAWRVLRGGSSVSLLNLTYDLSQTRLNKAHQAATFARRPLTPDMISYAASDVPPLIMAREHPRLGGRIHQLKFLERVYEESRARLPARLQPPAPEPEPAPAPEPAHEPAHELTHELTHEPAPATTPAAPLSAARCLSDDEVRACGAPLWAYTPRQLAALYALCRWRAALPEEEREALARHLPPRLLKNIAQRAPAQPAELQEIQGVSGDLERLYAEPLTRVIREEASGAPTRWALDEEDPLYPLWGEPQRPAPPASATREGALRRAWLRYISAVASIRLDVSLDTFIYPTLFSNLELYTLEGPDGDPLAELRPFLTGEEHSLFLRELERVAKETPLPSPPPEEPPP